MKDRDEINVFLINRWLRDSCIRVQLEDLSFATPVASFANDRWYEFDVRDSATWTNFPLVHEENLFHIFLLDNRKILWDLTIHPFSRQCWIGVADI